MRVETGRFGTLEVDETTVFSFPMGLLGFARHKRFVVLDHRDDSPFKWLQCVEDGQLAFIISDPLYFMRDYHVDVRRSELAIIAPDRAEDLIVSVIMTVPADPQEMSANLLAPLIFNMENRLAMQYVLTDHRYPVKHYVLREGEPTLARMPEGQDAAPERRSISLR